MSDDLLARHRAVLPDWMPIYYGDQAIEIVSGSGRRVTDAAGRTYLDFFGGVLTNMIGYDVAEINEAVRRQLATGVVHTSTLYLIREQVELAEKIARLSGIPDARVFLTNSGTEANETALLMATNVRRSNQILAIKNSYHGRTFATMAITGHRSWSSSALSPLNVSWLASGDRLRGRMAGHVARRHRRGGGRRPARGAGDGHRRGRGGADRRADPGRRRVRGAAGRSARRVPEGPGRARHPARSPTRCRPGGGAPASTSGDTRRTA